MFNKKLISVIVPVFNEEKFIEKCIKSILLFEKPKNIDFEIIIVDGNSNDKTVEILKKICKNHTNIFLINNPNKFQSFALNLGIRKSKGQYILRLDAHAEYPTNYLKICYETCILNSSDNTGGVLITKPGSKKFGGLLVQALTTHKFGVGDSSFRTEEFSGEVDTVPFGFFNRNIFDEVGFFDERLIRCQDYEFNRRIIASGNKIWMNSKIRAVYYNQPNLLSFLKKQFFLEAPYNPYLWYLAPYSFAFRHLITGIFSLGILVGVSLLALDLPLKNLFIFVVILYIFLSIVSAFQQSLRYKKITLLFTLPICFFLFHFVHGLGVLKGIFYLSLKKSPVQSVKEPWPGAGRFYGLENY